MRDTMQAHSALSETSRRILLLLQDLGLTENEAIVYKYLVENGGAITKEMLRDLNLRQPQLYDVISSLSRKNFVSIQESRPKRYIPANVDFILDKRARDIMEGREALHRWRSSIKLKRDNGPSMWVDRNWESFANNVRDIIAGAREQLCLEATPEIYNYFEEELIDRANEKTKIMILLFDRERRASLFRSQSLTHYSFTYVRTIHPGQFFAAIADDKFAAFMPRTIAFREPQMRYGYIFKDNDMAWFISHNFFYAWYIAENITGNGPQIPARHTSHRLAMSDLLDLWKEGKHPWVRIQGKRVADEKQIDIEGKVEKVTIEHTRVNFTVRTAEGEFTIGGYDSVCEDVEAHEIWILKEN
ncbi:MAG: TrmB family transcriptional regulator [Methanomassiliicoccales archaeon]